MSSQSGTPTRDERIARQERDLGSDEDTVYLGRTYGSDHYHEDPECPNLADAEDVREMSRGAAQRSWKAPCRRCIQIEEVEAS